MAMAVGNRLPSAKVVIAAFGNGHALARALKAVGVHRNPATIYKWTYPFPKGTGNIVPKEAWPGIVAAAKKAGVVLVGAKGEG